MFNKNLKYKKTFTSSNYFNYPRYNRRRASNAYLSSINKLPSILGMQNKQPHTVGWYSCQYVLSRLYDEILNDEVLNSGELVSVERKKGIAHVKQAPFPSITIITQL